MAQANRNAPLYALVAWSFFLLTCFGFFLFGVSQYPSGPDPHVVLANAKPACDEIIVALDQFHQLHHRYPERISELVDNGILHAVPEIPAQVGTIKKYGPYYESNSSLDFYRLSYGYLVKNLMYADDHYLLFISGAERSGWTYGGGHPKSMLSVVAHRILAKDLSRFNRSTVDLSMSEMTGQTPNDRTHLSQKYLDLFMTEVVGKAYSGALGRARIIGWIGEGVAIKLPTQISDTERNGIFYGYRENPASGYCLTFKDHWQRTLSSAPSKRIGKSPSVEKNFPVIDQLFRVQENLGKTTWFLVHQAPSYGREYPSGTYPIERD